jgi:hypothetical protein
MKKMVVFIVFATMMYSMCAMAQNVSNIKSVTAVPLENKTQQFFVLTEVNEKIQVSPLVYKLVEAFPEDYCVISVGNVKTVFNKADFANPTQYVFEVAKTDLVDDVPTVYMTNGYRFADPDLAWLSVLEGQKVQISRHIGLTREITVFQTVPRSTPVTNVDAAIASAPAKSPLPRMIEATKAKKAKKVSAEPQALAMSSDAPATDEGETSPGMKTITFSRR